MGNVPKKILMLIPSFGFGGAQKVFFNLGLELGKRFEIIECGFENDSNIAYPSNNQVLYLNVSGSQTYLGKFTNFFKRVSSLSKIKKSISPDFTISHLEGADYVNVLAKGPGKNILCIHGTKNYDKKIRGGLGFIRKKNSDPEIISKSRLYHYC